jgi:hypothetical protein
MKQPHTRIQEILDIHLNEKYLNSIQGYGEDHEVFINPTKRDMRDIKEKSPYGYRFLINHKDKKFYAFSANTYHQVFFDGLAQEEGLPAWGQFWSGGKGNSYLFSGHTDSGGRIDTDFFMQKRKEQDLVKLLGQNWDWAKKYIDIDAVRNVIIDYSGLDLDLY